MAIVVAVTATTAALLVGATPADAAGPPTFVRAWAAAGPAGIAAGVDGTVVVAEPADHRVAAYDGQGALLATMTGLTAPTAVGVDDDGTVYVLDGGTVARFSPSGAPLGTWATGLNTPTDLAVDGAGDVFVLSRAASGPSKRVTRFSPTGAVVTSWGARLESTAIAVLPDGSRVFTVNRHVEVGVTLSEILSTDATGGSPAYLNANASMSTATGLSTDGDGNVYATDIEHTVSQFAPNGVQVARWGRAGTAEGEFGTPADVARSGDRLFVADTGNDRVQAFTTAALTACRGHRATVYLGEGEVPTPQADVILGTTGTDDVDAMGGDDVVCSLGGDDTVAGGPGDDLLDGGDGADQVTGGGDADHLYGGLGADLVGGGDGPDVLAAGPGRDRLFGGAEGDALFGGYGADALAGNAGDDLCAGGPDVDRAAPTCEATRAVP